MNLQYITGVAAAVSGGIFLEIGCIMQKYAVNRLSDYEKQHRFILALLKQPLWVTGVIIQFVFGAGGFIAAQALIGPALAPGLLASGLVVLAIGSSKILGESLGLSEWVGILLMIAAVALMGFSGLQIALSVVQRSFSSDDALARMVIFTVVLTVIGIILYASAAKSGHMRGTLLALCTGIPYGIMNFWMAPLIAVIPLLGSGKFTFINLTMFSAAILIQVITNILAVRLMQESFKYAQAVNTVPLVKVAGQVAPIAVYFYIYALTPPGGLSALFMISGSSLVVISSFFLGRGQINIKETSEVTL